MERENEVREWRKYRRQSIAALPVLVVVLLLICLALFLSSWFVSVPTWLTVVLVGTAAFSVAGDVVNIIYLGRKLRKAEA